ncbi:MAG: SAM-dependent DNA methyltransferase, partial [bacterium]
WDAKRPITAQLLNLLDLAALARVLGKEDDVIRTLAEQQLVEYMQGAQQQLLFREGAAEYQSEPFDESRGAVSRQQRHAADGAARRC